MPLGFGDGGFDVLLKKAAASAKVMARDVTKGSSNIVAKVSEADMKGVARRMTNKVLERAEGGNFALVEEIPEVWRTPQRQPALGWRAAAPACIFRSALAPG